MKHKGSFFVLVFGAAAIGMANYAHSQGNSQGNDPANPGKAAVQTDVYSAKFLCGEMGSGAAGNVLEGPVKPGNYLTAINVHNPNGNVVILRKKALLLFNAAQVPPAAPETRFPPGPLVTVDLPPDWGFEIDCSDIRKVLLVNTQVPPPVFIKGFVVIEVTSQGPTPPTPPPPIDVVPVYTSHGFDIDASGVRTARGFSIAVERVPAVRRVF